MQLTALGTYETGLFDEGVAEISAYDPDSKRLFVVNGFTKAIDIFDFTNPSDIVQIGEISVAAYGDGANSIAVKDGVLAAAVENEDGNLPGEAVFFDVEGNYLSQVMVGVLPDMLTFTPDGSKVLVANEGEPTDDGDPEGSISIIDLSGGVASLSQAAVQTADFQGFNGQEAALQAEGLRLFPDKSVAEDVEPEYIAVSPDGSQAFVTLQENNGVAVGDISAAEIS
jgi:2',3'-cyclic-nucleotide 2'-phosphodiesterase/3'-nucleotidase/5'-nucleotidase